MEQPRAKIEIILNANGSLTVNGPLQDKILCWGMLHAAENEVAKYNPEAQSPIMLPLPIFGDGRPRRT
jgi:hypothetical protein